MVLELRQVRRCDGSCCRQAPRFPNADHSDCIYHKASDGKETSGCMLMTGEVEVPTEGGVLYKGLSTEGVYQETCVLWPQKNSELEVGDTGDCCWQLVDVAAR